MNVEYALALASFGAATLSAIESGFRPSSEMIPLFITQHQLLLERTD
jgi:hypothetical protein